MAGQIETQGFLLELQALAPLRFAARPATGVERSVELDPRHPISQLWLSFFSWEGRKEASIASARRAQELDPLNLYVNSVAGCILDFWGDTAGCVRECKKALELDPDHKAARRWLEHVEQQLTELEAGK